MLTAAILELTINNPENSHSSASALGFLPSLSLIVMAVIAWITAPLLSRLIPGRHDSPVPVSGLALRDLYAFAFVFLGLYFTLSSLADVFNWLHYCLMIAAHDPNLGPERKQSLYGLSRPLITFVAGLICLFYGHRWALKLAAYEKQTRQIAPVD